MLAQRQGAKAVIASLWPVADASTSGLMQEFYRLSESVADRSIHESLRKQTGVAWIAYDDPTECSLRAPVFLAPFLLMRNWL